MENVIRSQEEIVERFKTSDDFMGIQQGDLIEYMTFHNAKEFLNDDYCKQVESGDEKWETATDPKKQIIDYLDFAYDKAEGERGLSAGRSLMHFKTWIWLENDEFYNIIVGDLDSYCDYGISALDLISNHYGFER